MLYLHHGGVQKSIDEKVRARAFNRSGATRAVCST